MSIEGKYLVDNILTIDLEEWKHIHYLKSSKDIPSRLEANTRVILDLLEKYGTKATFFVVGETAEKNPEIIRQIVERDHEIGFHTYHHTPLWNLNREKLRHELQIFKKLMRDKFNIRVYGFRAPVFSLNSETSWAIDVLQKENILYDSSIFPIHNPVYGVPKAPVYPYLISGVNIVGENYEGILELPLLTYRVAGLNLPVAGGVYLRLLPLFLIMKALRKINKMGYPGVIYLHPREIDVAPPKLGLPFYKEKIFTFNTKNTVKKLEKLLESFSFCPAIKYVKGTGLYDKIRKNNL